MNYNGERAWYPLFRESARLKVRGALYSRDKNMINPRYSSRKSARLNYCRGRKVEVISLDARLSLSRKFAVNDDVGGRSPGSAVARRNNAITITDAPAELSANFESATTLLEVELA